MAVLEHLGEQSLDKPTKMDRFRFRKWFFELPNSLKFYYENNTFLLGSALIVRPVLGSFFVWIFSRVGSIFRILGCLGSVLGRLGGVLGRLVGSW